MVGDRPFRQAVQARRYDEVVDTQGLLFKSAATAWGAYGRRHGYDSQSIKEATAAWLYDVRHRVEKNQHAIVRNRALTALALGYAPQGEPDYGLQAVRAAAALVAVPYGVLLHATAQPGKEWPADHWRGLAAALAPEFELVLPWGTDAERSRALAITSGIARSRVPERRPLDEVARLIAGAAFVVGVDTGLMHLAAALGVPLVAIFTSSEPGLTCNGLVGKKPVSRSILLLSIYGGVESCGAVIATTCRSILRLRRSAKICERSAAVLLAWKSGEARSRNTV